MQGHNLPPQYHIPPPAVSLIAGVAAAATATAAGAIARSRSPSPAPSAAPSSVGPIPGAFSPSPASSSRQPYGAGAPHQGRYGTSRKIITTTPATPPAGWSPPVPPPPVPPKTPRGIPVPNVLSPETRDRPPLHVPVPPGHSDPFISEPPGGSAGLRPGNGTGSRPSSAGSAAERAAVEDATPISSSPSPSTSAGAYRITTPRKRKAVKAVRTARVAAGGVLTPRREKRERELQRELRERERERDRAGRGVERPSLLNTLGYLMIPLRVLAWPLKGVLSPVLAHFVNAALLLGLLAVLLYVLASKLSFLSAAFPVISTGVLLPFRTLATPTCLLANVGCTLSLLSDGNYTAQPFWRLFGPSGASVDVAAVSRSLTSEVRVAKDIFDSLLSLGDGRMMEGLTHVRIHELGIAIQTGSTLDERFFIGQELVELADTASSVADEIVKINAMSVSIFSWLFWEFSHVVKLLDLPDSSRPTPRTLSSRLDALVSRLDADLDRLHHRVGAAIPVAERGAQQGWSLHEHLSFIQSDLKAEHERYPTWQRALEAGKKFFAGGDPSKLTRISRDLDITQATITGITETRNSLERVRIGLVAFRDQVRHFSASVMGLHLGADEAIGLGPEQELAILSTVVGELGTSVGRAKRVPAGQDVPRLDAE